MAGEEMTWEMTCQKFCRYLGLRINVHKVNATMFGSVVLSNGYQQNWDEPICIVRKIIPSNTSRETVREALFELICEHLGKKTFLSGTFGKLDCMKRLSAKYTAFDKPSCPEEMMLKLEIADGISL